VGDEDSRAACPSLDSTMEEEKTLLQAFLEIPPAGGNPK
jgi:hypothetical protein